VQTKHYQVKKVCSGDRSRVMHQHRQPQAQINILLLRRKKLLPCYSWIQAKFFYHVSILLIDYYKMHQTIIGGLLHSCTMELCQLCRIVCKFLRNYAHRQDNISLYSTCVDCFSIWNNVSLVSPKFLSF